MVLYVRSLYGNSPQFKFRFFIKDFGKIINYFYSAENHIQYNLIIEKEDENVISALSAHLLLVKKNPEFDRNNIIIHFDNEEQKSWCEKYRFNSTIKNEVYINSIFLKKYEPQKTVTSYTYKNNIVSYYKYFRNEIIDIIRMEGLGHNYAILHLFSNSTYLFIQIPCATDKWFFKNSRDLLFTANPDMNPRNIIWEAPNLSCFLYALEHEFDAIMCNHNCWLDYEIFKIIPEVPKIYDLVINCRPEVWKRPFLAKKIDSLAFIKGSIYRTNDIYDYSELNYKYINDTLISPKEVNYKYNQSLCGGIFSEAEGACYSSSEYLLSGIPVISTDSKGGRDIWYNHSNSIIVSVDEESVLMAVKLCKYNIESGLFNPDNIRREHIIKGEEMRENFIKKVKSLFDLHNINIDSHTYFKHRYFHKFTKYMPLEEAIAEINH
jgi:hypothetical protein